MSIRGSTRLQATLVLTITLGCALLKYNYTNFINTLLKTLKNIDLSNIAILAKNEADIYKRNQKIIYRRSISCFYYNDGYHRKNYNF